MKKFIFLSLFIFLFVNQIDGYYYFGKNKVQYKDFDWQVLSTEHIDLYFYPAEKELAPVAVKIAEDSYKDLESRFNHTLYDRIPLILYSSHYDFEQTNITPYFLPEGVAGFTEFMKGRVVIPHTGSYSELKRVIKHELVHVFTFDKLSRIFNLRRTRRYSIPPLWFTEGIAEYFSGGEDSQADMVLRDAVLTNNLVSIPEIWKIEGTFTMYKEGESFCRYIANKYGEDKLIAILENSWKDETFDIVFNLSLHKTIKEIDTEWTVYLKEKYYPIVGNKESIISIAKQITGKGMNLQSAVYSSSNDTVSLVFLSSRDGYPEIYYLSYYRDDEDRMNLLKFESLVKSEISEKFEAIRFSKNRLSVKNNLMAFVSKKGEKDILYIYDVENKKTLNEISYKQIIAISNPSFSPDANKIAFIGFDSSGKSDLYITDTSKDNLIRLTNDIYDDRDVDWSPDGKFLVFSSDRNKEGENGYSHLFLYEISTGKISALTSGAYNDINPKWSKKGDKIAFSSDRTGSYNIHIIDFSIRDSIDMGYEGRETRNEEDNIQYSIFNVSNTWADLFTPDWIDDDTRLIFTAYHNSQFQIYEGITKIMNEELRIKNYNSVDSTLHSSLFTLNSNLDTSNYSWKPEVIEGDINSKKYKLKFGLDITGTSLQYDPTFGSGGGTEFVLTDMLGDHLIYLSLSNNAQTMNDFLESFNFGATYVNLSNRLNWAFGIFHYLDENYLFYSQLYDDYYYRERRAGGLFALSYPFSKFRRIEASTIARYSIKDFFGEDKSRSAVLNTNYLAYIKDTSLWASEGPIDGMRYNFTIGYTSDITNKSTNYLTLSGDLRKYFRISRRTCYAVRLMGRISRGDEPEIFYMGGSLSMRGYERLNFIGNNIFLWNNELRFPFLDRFVLGFPFGELELQNIRGALFFDYGDAWYNNQWGRKALKPSDFTAYGDFGFGIRINIGYYFVLRWDIAKLTNFKSISNETPIQFFIGTSY